MKLTIEKLKGDFSWIELKCKVFSIIWLKAQLPAGGITQKFNLNGVITPIPCLYTTHNETKLMKSWNPLSYFHQ